MLSITRTGRGFRGRSSRSVLLAACLVAAGVLPGAASAEPPRGQLVVEGEGNTTVTLEVQQELRIQDAVPELSGGTSHAAVLVEGQDDGTGPWPVPLGAVRVRAFGDETSEAVGLLGGGGGILEPGRYRVTLLGDGPVRAVYRLQDPQAPGLRVVPRIPIRSQFFGRAERLLDGRSRATVFLPDVVPAGARAIQVGLTAGTSADDYRMCTADEPRCPGNPLPFCPPSPLPCGSEETPGLRAGTEPGAQAQLRPAQPARTGLHWSVDGYRDAPGKLRAAAIVF